MSLGNKEIMSQNIKYYMNKFGVDRNKLCDDLGFKYMTVSDWINAKTYPRIDKIEMLADYFGVSKADLVEHQDIDEKDVSTIYTQLTPPRQKKVYSFAEEQLEEQNKKHAVTTYGPVAAGSALEYGDGFIEERSVSYVPDKAERALVVKGESMEPDFPDGSVVFYIEQPMVENGEIAIVEINKEAVTCKKIKFDYENQKIVLQSLNPEYGDMQFESHEVKVLGKVVK